MVTVLGVYETFEDAHDERMGLPIGAPVNVVQTTYRSSASLSVEHPE